ncbi:hypothetical protein LPN04_30720 [Rugamonas sp. A1-17]|nr:hypothetical protein [Rugamonas sp. A1-17]
MAEWTRETPWRQGRLLSREAADALNLHHATEPGRTLVVVASHDCDLAQAPENEPMVEVIVGRAIDELNGNNTHAKVPRRLHIAFEGASPCLGEFEATAKISVSKNGPLADFLSRPDSMLSPENANTFQRWLASRYRRSAFPDEFDRRLKDEKLAEKITKAVKPHGELISGVFFDVDEGLDVKRDGAEDTYTLDIYILHPDEPDHATAAAAAQQTVEQIRAAFTNRLFIPTKSWKQIELRYSEALSEAVLTYQQYKQLKRWPLDHISLGGAPQQAVPAD